MRQNSGAAKRPTGDAIKDIARVTRRWLSAEEKIRIRAGRPACSGKHGRTLPPREYHRVDVLWLAERVPGGWQETPRRSTARALTSDEVKDLRRETQAEIDALADPSVSQRLVRL